VTLLLDYRVGSPIQFNTTLLMKNLILVLILTVSVGYQVTAADHFWVGGAGNWSDSTVHWSLTSGGAPGATLPKKGDNVFFDTNSGLTLTTDVVTVDTIILADQIDFSAIANLFEMNSVVTYDHIIYGSITGNTSGINFTGTWGEIQLDTELAGESILSSGISWIQDFRVQGLSIDLSDDFISSGDFFIDSAGVVSNGNSLSVASFFSQSTAVRIFDFTNSVINVSSGVWEVFGANLTSTFTGSSILLGNTAGTAQFIGGAQQYDTLRSVSATRTEITDDNLFALLVCPPSTELSINNGDNISVDSLILNGTCGSSAQITELNAGANATITKTGYQILSLTSIVVDGVNAAGAATYNLALSEVLSGNGWTLTAVDFYWINDSGNWNDISQWSNSSNGPISGCIPGPSDLVFFDANSFTASNQTVVIDDTAYARFMDWSAVVGAHTMRLDSSLYMYGDIVLSPNLTLNRGALTSTVFVKDNSDLTTSNANVDCNFTISMDNSASLFQLMDDLITTDSSSIIQLNGKFHTNNNFLRTGSIITADNPGSTADQREIDFSGSSIELFKEFSSLGDSSLTLIAGTSNLYIGDNSGFGNNLVTAGQSFHNVTLDFIRNSRAQKVQGSNDFNKLIITAGSEVYFEEGATQTINDSLVAKGTCLDSITIHTLDTVSLNVANLDKTGADYILECLNLTGIENTGDTLTTYFSTDKSNNDKWVFNASLPITTSFQPDSTLSSFCFGDTVYFDNTSTPLNGNINDLTFEWSVSDGSLPIQELTSTVEANKTGTQVNYAQTTGTSSDALSPIVSWTETADPQGIFDPVTGELNTTAGNENVSYNFTVGYRLSLVNATGSDAYLVDMDSDPDTVEYNYRPEVKIFKNGSQFGVGSSQFAFPTHIFEEDTLTNGVTQIGTDTVSFSLVAQNLVPADILAAQIGVDVSYVSFTDEPRWKDATLTSGNDVNVTYRIDIDTIYMRAVPATPSYEIEQLVHEFESSGDSMIVEMNAIDTRNFCEVRDTFYINIIEPQSSLLASITSSPVCPNTEIEFEAFSTVDTTQFEFLYNGVSQNTPSANDTLFMVNPIMQDDTISLRTYERGCESDTVLFYTYDVYAAPTFTWNNDAVANEICQNDSVIFTSTSPDSVNTFQYLVNNGSVSGILDSLATYTTDNLNNNDLVSLVVTDTNNCRDTSSITFTVNALPNTILTESTGGNVICENDNVTFTAANGDLFEFYLNDTLVQGSLATTTWTTDSLSSGDIVSAVGVSTDGCSFEAPSTFSYFVNPAPNVTLSSSDADNIICSGDNVTFSASGAAVYQFFVDGVSVQGPSTLSSYSSNGLANTEVVSVQGSVSGCLGNVPTITMTVNASPTTTLTNDDDGDNEICQGTTVIFTGNGATNYEFFVDGVSQGSASTVNTFISSTIQNGQIIEVVGESNGCEVAASNTFSVLSIPNVNMTSNHPTNTICDGDPIDFTGSNASNYEYFVNNASVQGPITNPLLSNPTFISGLNDVFVVGEANNGCTDTSQVIQVQVNPIPTITVVSSDPDNTICEGESVTFTASGGDNYQFVLGSTPQTSLSPTNTFVTSNLTNGQQLIVNGQLLGCENTSNTITTVVNPSPNVVLTSSDVDNIFCADDLVAFTASGATNYEFFVDGVSQGAPSPTNTINSAGFTIGTYQVTVDGEANNCSTTAGFNVTVNGLPAVSLTSSDIDNSICDGETVTYTGAGAALYEFFINGVSQGSPNPTASISINTLNDNDVVSVEGASAAGCSSSAAMPAIEVLPIPAVILTSTDPDEQICDGDAVTFTGAGAAQYEFFINGTSQGALSPLDNITTSNLNNGDVITVEGELSGCTALSSSLNFQVYGYPIVNLVNNEDTVLCIDELTDLTANGAIDYLFYVNGNPLGTMSPVNTFNSTLTNGDVVTVEGETNGCASFSSVSIDYSVFNYPTVNAVSSDGDLEICFNDTVTFTSTGANEYVYEINGLQIGSDAIGDFDTDAIANGDVFSVIGYNAHCASAPVDFTFVVNEMSLDLIVSPSNMICEGDNVDFTASGADEYEFFINGVSTGAQSATNIFTTNTLAHQDEVTFTGFNNTTGCSQAFADFVIMSVLDEPIITPQSSVIFCEGDSVILVSNADYGNEWYLNNIPIAGATDTSYLADSTGSYTLQVTMGGDGDLWSLGQNAAGVFANGTSFNSSVPVASTTALNFTEISAGFNFVMGIDDNKELHAWGNNATGQLGNGTFTASTNPIQVGALADVKTVATGSNSTMATLETGEVYVWGNNIHGQLGTGNTSVINFPFQNTNLTNVDTIAAGRSHYVVLKNDGTVETVGNNDYGQLGDGTLLGSNLPLTVSLSNVVAVGASEYSSYAIDNTGALFVWGNNASGQLGLGDLTNRLTPALSDLSDVTSVQGGANHAVFLTTENKVYTTGGNAYGQLGSGDQVDSNLPKEVDLEGVEMIAAGQYTTLMKRTDNSVFAAGNNTENQLLAITDTAIVDPVHMSSLEGVTFIESSQNASHFLFGQSTTCESAPVVTDFLPSPDVNILSDGDTLSTDQLGAAGYQWYFNGNPVQNGNTPTIVANSSGTYSVEVTYSNGCTSTSDDYMHSVTSVKELVDFAVELYPNPTREVLNINVSKGVEIVGLTVVDNVGKIVYKAAETDSNKTVRCEALENGVYYIRISTNQGNITRQFVVNR
jgi:alpha-tubulin suppressor-like RCC1 family protein